MFYQCGCPCYHNLTYDNYRFNNCGCGFDGCMNSGPCNFPFVPNDCCCFPNQCSCPCQCHCPNQSRQSNCCNIALMLLLLNQCCPSRR
ncbi:MAG: hypothetical protein RR400_03690 [Clostridia bacterium]